MPQLFDDEKCAATKGRAHCLTATEKEKCMQQRKVAHMPLNSLIASSQRWRLGAARDNVVISSFGFPRFPTFSFRQSTGLPNKYLHDIFRMYKLRWNAPDHTIIKWDKKFDNIHIDINYDPQKFLCTRFYTPKLWHIT